MSAFGVLADIARTMPASDAVDRAATLRKKGNDETVLKLRWAVQKGEVLPA